MVQLTVVFLPLLAACVQASRERHPPLLWSVDERWYFRLAIFGVVLYPTAVSYVNTTPQRRPGFPEHAPACSVGEQNHEEPVSKAVRQDTDLLVLLHPSRSGFRLSLLACIPPFKGVSGLRVSKSMNVLSRPMVAITVTCQALYQTLYSTSLYTVFYTMIAIHHQRITEQRRLTL